jgi:hypothetical protein
MKYFFERLYCIVNFLVTMLCGYSKEICGHRAIDHEPPRALKRGEKSSLHKCGIQVFHRFPYREHRVRPDFDGAMIKAAPIAFGAAPPIPSSRRERRGVPQS